MTSPRDMTYRTNVYLWADGVDHMNSRDKRLAEDQAVARELARAMRLLRWFEATQAEANPREQRLPRRFADPAYAAMARDLPEPF